MPERKDIQTASRRVSVSWKRYWGNYLCGIGCGVWSTGNITDEMVQEYLDYYRNPSNEKTDSIVLE